VGYYPRLQLLVRADGYRYFDEELTKSVNVLPLTPQVSDFKIADIYKA
jgi:hypothetical protein